MEFLIVFDVSYIYSNEYQQLSFVLHVHLKIIIILYVLKKKVLNIKYYLNQFHIAKTKRELQKSKRQYLLCLFITTIHILEDI